MDYHNSPNEESESSLLTLRVTQEQRDVITALFLHNGWDMNEVGTVNAERADTNAHYEACDNYRIAQDPQVDECESCLCRPCITSEGNRQLWWEETPQIASFLNGQRRKGHYKRFWTCLLHRGAWHHHIYVARKNALLSQEVGLENIVMVGPGSVSHCRDIMPECVLKMVRHWLPNPKCKDYIGHKWN